MQAKRYKISIIKYISFIPNDCLIGAYSTYEGSSYLERYSTECNKTIELLKVIEKWFIKEII